MSTKTVLSGIVILALAVAVYFGVNGFPPSEDGAEGTIGVAERHHSEQIQAADIILEDPEFQQCLQSDVVQRLSAGPRRTRAQAPGEPGETAVSRACPRRTGPPDTVLPDAAGGSGFVSLAPPSGGGRGRYVPWMAHRTVSEAYAPRC